MILSVRVRCVRRDNVTYPAQRSSRADPETGRNDEPEYARKDSAVIELSDPGNKKT